MIEPVSPPSPPCDADRAVALDHALEPADAAMHRLLDSIVLDCQTDSQQYLVETLVPYGGE